MSWSVAPEVLDPALEPLPAAAGALFADRLPLAVRYAELLAGPGALRGLIGPREAARIWTRHVLNCAVVADLVPEAAAVADLGSGAGLPGIVLALVRPDLEVTLVEPMARRTEFLAEVVDELGLTGVRVCRDRGEQHAAANPARYDVVTARAVTDLATLHAWSRPMLRRGGVLLALKGARAEAEVAATATLLRQDAVGATISVLGRGLLPEPTTVVVVGAAR